MRILVLPRLLPAPEIRGRDQLTVLRRDQLTVGPGRVRILASKRLSCEPGTARGATN